VSAVGAALVDPEGETVDYAGSLDPFDVKVMAAEWCIMLALLRESTFPGWARTDEVLVRCSQHSFAIFALGEGYALVLQLLPHAFVVSHRAVCEAIHDICEEAAIEVPDRFKERWARVDVRDGGRPSCRPEAVWMEGEWQDLEVLGRYLDDDLQPREMGFRTRVATGAEVTLVRERCGIWFADDLPGN
jgi:hypothetical protein